MSKETWTAVDDYAAELLVPQDEALQSALESSRAAGLPQIQVSRAQGKWLHLLARAIGARNILELGTLGGYSAIWLGRALPPDGRMITLEIEPKHAEVARANLARAGLTGRVEIRLGPAAASLDELARERAVFDLIFIDADKTGYPIYLPLVLKVSRPGTVIVGDNVVREGKLVDRDNPDENVRAVRQFLEMLAAEPRISSTVLQTVGAKGYDGFAIAVVE